MYRYSISENLKKKIGKIFKKDRLMYEILLGKIKEIIESENIDHYKNLRRPLHEFKRVHIKSSFVLIFKYSPSEKKIEFFDIDHHDNIYF